MTLGYSSVNSNQVLQPNIAVGGANPSNAHFTNSFGSIVGGVSGCGGAGGSAAALAAKPGYNIMQKGGKGGVTGNGSGYNLRQQAPQTGGKNGAHRRGGSKRNKRTKRSNKGGGYASQAVNLEAWQDQALKVKGGSNKRNKRSNKRNKRTKRSNKGGYGSNSSGYDLKVKGCSNKRNKRSKRGGLSAMSPASFSGAANAPYHQFTGGQPLSFNYGMGSRTPLPLNLIGVANPPPMMDIRNNCGSNHGLVGKGLLN